MKKAAVKTVVITLLYCFEGFINGNKSFIAFMMMFACIFGRTLIQGECKNRTGGEQENGMYDTYARISNKIGQPEEIS